MPRLSVIRAPTVWPSRAWNEAVPSASTRRRFPGAGRTLLAVIARGEVDERVCAERLLVGAFAQPGAEHRLAGQLRRRRRLLQHLDAPSCRHRQSGQLRGAPRHAGTIGLPSASRGVRSTSTTRPSGVTWRCSPVGMAANANKPSVKIGRNDPMPVCGAPLKFKRCCGR